MTKQKSNLTGLLLVYLFSSSELTSSESFIFSPTGGLGISLADFFDPLDEKDQINNIRKIGFFVEQNNSVIIF